MAAKLGSHASGPHGGRLGRATVQVKASSSALFLFSLFNQQQDVRSKQQQVLGGPHGARRATTKDLALHAVAERGGKLWRRSTTARHAAERSTGAAA
ncbi:hypothetical protein GUJ93_ZPchr0010g9491 [Zizania palustris]|uniref:Uncharacterized protein n=1 Tax=Zizania palustris TaxID=103762 RepID=A0A8J5SZE4_ZIZPA|nr:hypothetical protein GUJ93_ZPchr0010g9491 [Zizania palustris]